MTLKNVAFLAFLGTLLLTIVVTFDFVNTALGVLRNIVPAVAVLRLIIYLFASVSVTVFFYVFYKGQSR
jgi:hypothetical protein